MKMQKSLAMGFIAVSIMALVGCGGGAEKAKITQENVDTLGKNAAKILPGCEYNSDNVLGARMDDDLTAAYALVGQEVKKLKAYHNGRSVKLGHTIDESEAGTCGGTYHKVGTHVNGIEDVTYTYDHYCSGDVTKKTVITGVVTVHSDSTPTPSGPELNSMDINTGDEGLVTEATAGGTTETQTVVVKNLKYVVGKDGQPSILSADRIKTTSGEGEGYEVSNVSVEFTGDETGGSMTVKNATYTDPDVGAVTVKTTSMAYGNGATGSGTITLTGSDGKVDFKTDDMSTMKFTAYLDDKPAGSIDCSKANAN